MYKQTLSSFEKIKIFLTEYFFGYGIYYTMLRILAGPLIFLIGLNQYLSGSTKAGISYSGVMMFFGVYYLLKPLLTILTQKSWFDNFNLNYIITENLIIIESDKSKSELNYSNLKSILKRNSYYALKTKSKQGIYLPVRLLEPHEIEILDSVKTN